jgi:acyl-CoA thioester hydrolase
VVIEANAKYHSNVGYDTLVTVRTKISDLRRVRVSFKYKIVDDQCGLLVSGYTVHACVNSNSKPMRIPTELREIMAGNLKI